MEVVVATVIAVIAVLALAYSFGAARGLVDRYEIARVALAAAQRRMETLSAGPLTSTDLLIGPHPAAGVWLDVKVEDRAVARESWTVDRYDDPANGIGSGAADLKRVTVTVVWGQAGPAETVSLTRLFPLP